MNANLIGFGWKEKIYLGPTNLEFVNMGRLVIYFIINNKGSTSEHQTRVPKYVVQLYWNINQRAKNQSAKKCLKNIAYLHNYIGTKYFAFIKSYLFWWGQFWTGPQPLFASSHWDNYPSLARPIAAFLYKKNISGTQVKRTWVTGKDIRSHSAHKPNHSQTNSCQLAKDSVIVTI